MPCALLIEWPRRCDSGYDIRRAAARQFRDAGKVVDCTGQRCECFRGFPVQAAAAMCVAFEIDTQRRTFGAGAGQPQHRARVIAADDAQRSEEHTSELQSLMRSSYAVFCLKKKKKTNSRK